MIICNMTTIIYHESFFTIWISYWLEATESSSEDEEDDLEDERMRQEAVAEKERGNSFFKLGNYDMAIEKYTRGQTVHSNCIYWLIDWFISWLIDLIN